MIKLADIKPLFYINTVFGNPPHVIKNDNFIITKLGSVYSVVWCCTFFYFVYNRLHEILTKVIEIKLLILRVSRTVSFFTCLYTDYAIGYFSRDKFSAVIHNLRSYDAAMQIDSTGNSGVRCVMWIFVTVRVIYWTVVGYIHYLYSDEEPFVVVFSSIFYACILSQCDKFVGIMLLLYTRFRHLNELLVTNDIRVNVHVKNGHGLHLQDIWWLHGCLMDAAEILNSIYSMQLLFWITSLSFNLASRLYTLRETWPQVHILVLKESPIVISSVIVLVTITTMCHVTSDQANKVGPTIFSSPLALSGKSGPAAENIEVGMYFQLRQLEFSAIGGFIRVDLPLLLSITAAITTFLVILHTSDKI